MNRFNPVGYLVRPLGRWVRRLVVEELLAIEQRREKALAEIRRYDWERSDALEADLRLHHADDPGARLQARLGLQAEIESHKRRAMTQAAEGTWRGVAAASGTTTP